MDSYNICLYICVYLAECCRGSLCRGSFGMSFLSAAELFSVVGIYHTCLSVWTFLAVMNDAVNTVYKCLGRRVCFQFSWVCPSEWSSTFCGTAAPFSTVPAHSAFSPEAHSAASGRVWIFFPLGGFSIWGHEVKQGVTFRRRFGLWCR